MQEHEWDYPRARFLCLDFREVWNVFSSFCCNNTLLDLVLQLRGILAFGPSSGDVLHSTEHVVTFSNQVRVDQIKVEFSRVGFIGHVVADAGEVVMCV